MLSIEDLSFSYGSVQTLRNVNMNMQPSRVTCVIGRNGAGKTTLMKNIMGLLKSSGGTVRMDDKDLTPLPAYRRARTGLALAPQGRQIFPKLTVEENLRVGLQARRDRVWRIPDEVFDLFPVLKEMSGRKGGDLSGGQQQQLAIGRALVGNPQVLLLDEPTEGIQPNIIRQIGDILRRLVDQRNMTIVLVEQYLDFVREFGHDFYVMDRGQVVASGEMRKLSEELVNSHLTV
jgi:urea transport system ATP-binding protein